MDAGVAALIGAVVGCGTTLAVNLFQTGLSKKQERVKAAVQLAITEYEREIALAKTRGEQDDVPQLAQYVASHGAVLAMLEKGGVGPEKLEELAKKYDVYYDSSDHRGKQ